MRLITRRIYRAFPELDRYSDEQCERFVRAARGRLSRRWGRDLVIGLVVGVALVGSVALASFVYSVLDGSPPGRVGYSGWLTLLFVFLAVPCVAIGPVLAFLTRDWLLRTRVRYVLRARGVCLNCGYSLVGLPVGEAAAVACPECATECHVDPSLGELVLDEAGRARYQPSPAAISQPFFFTPARTRFAKRAGLVVALLILIVGGGSYGLYELTIRKQAALALSEKPGAAGVLEFVEKHQPAGTSATDPNAWDALARAILMLDVVDARVWQPPKAASVSDTEVRADFTQIYAPRKRDADATPDVIARDTKSAELARSLIEFYRADGVYDKLREITATPRAVRPINMPPGQPMINMLLPELGKARQFARINAARMFIAREKGDLTEFIDAFETNLAISRILYYQPTLIDGLVAIAIEALSYGQLRPVLMSNPDAAWLDAIRSAIDRQAARPPATYMIEAERLNVLDTLAWVFSNLSEVRKGAVGAMAAMPLSGEARGRMGFYTENRDAVNVEFSRLAAELAQPRWLRDPVVYGSSAPTGLRLVDGLMPAMARMLQSIDQCELEPLGAELMIAIERFRLAKGEYPDALAELSPEFLKSPVLDPWSGKPFGYRRVDPKSDPQGRGYLLYTVGGDGVDNQGREATGSAKYEVLKAPASTGPSGFDLVVNDRVR